MIEFRNVRKEYGSTVALEDISFKINDGEFVFIIGQSGAGKTTITKLLLCEERATGGDILVDGTGLTELAAREIPYYRRNIGMVFQDFRLFGDKTALENVEFAMRVIGTPGKEIRQRAPMLLKALNVLHIADHKPSELSGGEQQRVALARALANRPSIIIADEPTGNVDPKMSMEIMQLLLWINQNLGKTVIVVTHERFVDSLGQRVINIKDGKVMADTPAHIYAEVLK